MRREPNQLLRRCPLCHNFLRRDRRGAWRHLSARGKREHRELAQDDRMHRALEDYDAEVAGLDE